jgi:FkbM family methyltransferase
MFDTEVERVTTRYGRLYIASDDAVIGRSLRIYGEWAEDEISAYAALLTDGETIVDVGANIGTHSIALASRFPHSQVVAFEPQPLAFSLLAANVLAARTGNVFPHNCGCAEAERVVHATADYASVEWNIGAFSLLDAGEEQTDAAAMLLVALDGVAFRGRVQFIKIDVEGMEGAVLAGAKQLIARDRPIIYFEVLEMPRLAALSTVLVDLGYELRWLKSEAFNARNFRLNPENIWSRGETGVLALPSANDPRVGHLDVVTSEESDVPVIEYSASKHG